MIDCIHPFAAFVPVVRFESKRIPSQPVVVSSIVAFVVGTLIM